MIIRPNFPLRSPFALSIALVAASLAAPAVAPAQSSALQRFERRIEQVERERAQRFRERVPADRRALLEYGGYYSQQLYAIDDLGAETRLLRLSDLTLFARADLDGAHRVFLRGRVAYQDFNDGDSFDREGDQWEGPELERGFYEFDLRSAARASGDRAPGFNLQARGGRQLVHWGNGLVLSQTLDGGRVVFEGDALEVTAIAGRTWEEETDIDSSRPGFDNETHRWFFGERIAYDLTPHHRPYGYILMQEDENRSRPLRIGGTTTEFKYDSVYYGLGSKGDITDNWQYGVELTYQDGNSLSFEAIDTDFDNIADTVRQTAEDIDAWALDLRTNYFFRDDHRVRLIGELLLASGDADRGHTTNTFNGNAPGTDDEAFNGFGLINTGLAFAPNASNLVMGRLGANGYPLAGQGVFDSLQLGLEFFTFHKLEEDGPIDEPTTNDGHLGEELDLYANWQIASDLSWNVRYGVFFPGEAIVDGNDGVRHFAMTGVTLGF